MEMPEQERLDLARRIVASIAAERENSEAIAQAVRGIEDVITGKTRGLSEAEFRHALHLRGHPRFSIRDGQRVGPSNLVKVSGMKANTEHSTFNAQHRMEG